MKKFVNEKAVCTVIFCLIIAVMLCACKSTPSSLEIDDPSQTTSATSSIDSKNESVSEDTKTSATSSIKTESSSKSSPESNTSSNTRTENQTESSKSSAGTNNSTPVSPEPIVSEPTVSEPTVSEPTVTTPKTPAQLIVGKWRGSVDIAPLFSEMGYSVEGVQLVSCDIEFTEGGIMYETIDRESLRALYTNMFNNIMNDAMVENNLTKEQFEESIGKTYDEYVNDFVQIAMELVPYTSINAYKFEGDSLYVRTQNTTDFIERKYSLNGENELTVLDSDIDITYTRVK